MALAIVSSPKKAQAWSHCGPVGECVVMCTIIPSEQDDIRIYFFETC